MLLFFIGNNKIELYKETSRNKTTIKTQILSLSLSLSFPLILYFISIIFYFVSRCVCVSEGSSSSRGWLCNIFSSSLSFFIFYYFLLNPLFSLTCQMLLFFLLKMLILCSSSILFLSFYSICNLLFCFGYFICSHTLFYLNYTLQLRRRGKCDNCFNTHSWFLHKIFSFFNLLNNNKNFLKADKILKATNQSKS